MSHNKPPISPEILAKCPNFLDYNNRARQHLLDRFTKHHTTRLIHINKCANQALKQLSHLLSSTCNTDQMFVSQIMLDPNNDIIQNSINQMRNQIDRSPIVQMRNQIDIPYPDPIVPRIVQVQKCKKIISSYQQFLRMAIGKQDQNSWKISGKYFFAEYVVKFRKLLEDYYGAKFMNVDCDQTKTNQIINLGCLLFGTFILNELVKFERAKEKPLLRDRTLVHSRALHQAFKKLHPMLDVSKFRLIEKAKLKQIRKRIISISSQFHFELVNYCQYLLIKQKQMLSINTNRADENAKIVEFPLEWLGGAFTLKKLISNEEMYLICVGYVKRNYCQYITDPIIRLLSSYIAYDLPIIKLVTINHSNKLNMTLIGQRLNVLYDIEALHARNEDNKSMSIDGNGNNNNVYIGIKRNLSEDIANSNEQSLKKQRLN